MYFFNFENIVSDPILYIFAIYAPAELMRMLPCQHYLKKKKNNRITQKELNVVACAYNPKVEETEAERLHIPA